MNPEPGTYPFIVTGAIARMQSPVIIELPCVGRYAPNSFSLAAYAIIPPQTDPESGVDSPPTWVDVSIECTEEAVIDGGAERTYVGVFQVREFAAVEPAVEGQTHQKGPLTVMHQFHIEMAMRRTQ